MIIIMKILLLDIVKYAIVYAHYVLGRLMESVQRVSIIMLYQEGIHAFYLAGLIHIALHAKKLLL